VISRPQPAHRFQLLCSREELPQAMAALVRRFGVQLEAGPELQEMEQFTTLTPELAQRLNHYRDLASRFRAYWPKKPAATKEFISNRKALDQLDQAIAALELWRADAQPAIEQLHGLQAKGVDLSILFDMLTNLGESTLDFSPITTPVSYSEERFFDSSIFVIPQVLKEEVPTEPLTLLRTVTGESHTFLVAVGLPVEIQTLMEWVAATKGRVFNFPSWCKGDVGELLPETLLRMEKNQQEQNDLRDELENIAEKHEVASLLHITEQLEWFFSIMEKTASNEQLAHVEGWTDGGVENSINSYFDKVGIKALIDVAKAKDDNPPMLLVNPRWAKPFELFPRLLGIPGRDEADPSPLLTIIAPLLFGYMFGDVGQGAVLAWAGFALRKKFAAAWLMISGGASAVFFGFLFGSIFSREDIISPLWLHPTQEPLTVLAVPLVLGFLLILGGMLLKGLGEFWVGRGERWLQSEGGILLLYVGAVLAFLHPIGWSMAAIGLCWYLIGNYLLQKSFMKILGKLGHLVELSMQLGVNTLSFARVGAFALAHAGLSMAVMTLAELPQSMFAGFIILFFGNVLILALEGLVVSVQTTRLILFEFFVRFLRGAGRPFRPLPAPPQ
jgi:V/A-type H+/Na+-transporting ATPase subunit I